VKAGTPELYVGGLWRSQILNCDRHGRPYTRSVIKNRPPRLEQIFQSYDPALFLSQSVLSIDVKLITWTPRMRPFEDMPSEA